MRPFLPDLLERKHQKLCSENQLPACTVFCPKQISIFLSERRAASVHSDPQEKPSLSAGPLRPCWCPSGQHGAGSPCGLPGLLLGLPSWQRHHPHEGGSASQGSRGVSRRHRAEEEEGDGSVVLSTAERRGSCCCRHRALCPSLTHVRGRGDQQQSLELCLSDVR